MGFPSRKRTGSSNRQLLVQGNGLAGRFGTNPAVPTILRCGVPSEQRTGSSIRLTQHKAFRRTNWDKGSRVLSRRLIRLPAPMLSIGVAENLRFVHPAEAKLRRDRLPRRRESGPFRRCLIGYPVSTTDGILKLSTARQKAGSRDNVEPRVASR